MRLLLKRKEILWFMLFLAVFLGMSPGQCLSMPVDSQLLIQPASSQSVYLEKVQRFLDKEIVRQRLSRMGLTKEDAAEYINKLDDSRLRQISAKIDTVEAAGDSGLVLVLLLLLIVMCVLYFSDYGFKLEPRRKK